MVVSLTITEITNCITSSEDCCHLPREMSGQRITQCTLTKSSEMAYRSQGLKMKEWEQKQCCHQFIFPRVLA